MLVQTPSVKKSSGSSGNATTAAPSWSGTMRSELHDVSTANARARASQAELLRAYAEAVKLHPFRHNAHSTCDVYSDCVLRDGKGAVVAVLIRDGLPAHAATAAAQVLRGAATRTTLRMNIYGGEAPHSGIAGYFDYRGTPIEHKYRKTAFTYEHADTWPAVFAMVDYVSALYKRALPQCWHAQDAAIPDVVRIHGSPFSTLTINSRFRTASHTDAGDFDAGLGCLACLEGEFAGMCLTLDDFRVNVTLQPGDVLLFNTHHFHSNTELEINDGAAAAAAAGRTATTTTTTAATSSSWSRLTCVFYYRAALGEAAAYATYERRLLCAQRALATAMPQHAHERATRHGDASDNNDNDDDNNNNVNDDDNVRRAMQRFARIDVKPNGENLNKPSPVHALDLTPFLVLTMLRRRGAGCAAAARRVHAWLLRDAHASAALFGEPLHTPDGMPARADDELVLANAVAYDARASVPRSGFAQSDATLRAAAAKQRYLELTYLSHCLGDGLLAIWRAARAQWLARVAEEWARLRARQPGRDRFAWNNRSAMSAAFVDLCEVARQVMLALLATESATAAEERAFWAIFAAHLCQACREELHMPASAIPMQKLNVKVKDYQFGGTRYFKDMPADEQQRRLERKAALEQARRQHTTSRHRRRYSSNNNSDDDDDTSTSSSVAADKDTHGDDDTDNDAAHTRAQQWLTSDVFDYQSEDATVDYAGHGWPTPDAHARRCVDEVAMHVDDVALPDAPTHTRRDVHVLVVLPVPRNNNSDSGGNDDDEDDKCSNRSRSKRKKTTSTSGGGTCRRRIATATTTAAAVVVAKTHRDSDESRRLLCTRAARRLLQLRKPVNDTLPPPRHADGVVVTYAYQGSEPTRTFDFVVTQHVLAHVSCDDDARAYVQQLRQRATGCVLMAETDLQCRYYYMLKHTVRDAYLAVATDCYQQLHRAKYGCASATVRAKAALERVVAPHCLARYKLHGSVLNTMLLLVSGAATAADAEDAA